MATLAAYPGMMRRDRRREGLRVCRAAWLIGVSVREYREIEAGDRMPSPDTYERICKLYGWPQTFVETSDDPAISGREGHGTYTSKRLIGGIDAHLPNRALPGERYRGRGREGRDRRV